MVIDIPDSTVPDARVPFPDGVRNRVKYFLWRLIYPFHNPVRDLLLGLRIIHHSGRQNFKLGTLSTDKSADDFLRYLASQGFGGHFIAWVDDGEIIGVRKLDGFEYQYHLRLFNDGEVRGHYEYTPEFHFLWHMQDRGMRPERETFMAMLGGWVVADQGEAKI